jgi:ribose/xylose/arabinose/galactoside ABC-type transport system permease subunit
VTAVAGRIRSLAPGLRAVPPSAWVLLALFVLLALVVPRFLTSGNLMNVARVAAILALAAFGQAVVVVSGGIDFSSGSSVALTSVVAVLSLPHVGAPEALALGAAAALAIGAVNGFLIGWLEMPPFLATLGVLIAGHGLASLLVGGIPLDAPAAPGFSWLAHGRVLGLPAPIAAAALGLAGLSVLLRRTVLGRAWYLVGASARAAEAAGVDVRRRLFMAHLVGSGFVAAAGLILTSRVASGQPNLYPTLPFEAIAACAIGGLPLTGGAGSALQVLVGVLIVAVVQNAVVLLNVPASVQLMLIGALTAGAVLAQQVRWPVRAARRP